MAERVANESNNQQAQEARRLTALHSLDILDTPREAVFDHITAITSRVFGSDMTCITLVDEHRFYFKSTHGCDVVESPKESGLCDVTVDLAKVRVVRDTTTDPVTQTHGMVCTAPFVRFYAGAPLVTPEGVAIGTLCVMHSGNLDFTREDEGLLQELADYVMFQIVYRKELLDAKASDVQHYHKQKRMGLGLLAGGVAHDLNNYLMGIAGNTSLVQAMIGDGEPVQERLASIVDATDRATELTNQLMVYAGERVPNTEIVDATELLSEVLKELEGNTASGISLELAVDDTTLPVLADPVQLRQVMVNLVNNAVEAYGEASGTVTVALRREQDARLVLEVRDRGVGMDELTRQSLFEPFFSTKLTGRGLGMAITEQVVKAHGGEIHVDSEPGEGTTLSVYLPLADGIAMSVANGNSASGELALSGRHLMIIDDERHIRDFLVNAGGFLGLTVTAFSNGADAIESLANEPLPDLVLVDASMPGMSGEEALERIQKDHPDITAIVMSGHDLPTVKERFKRCKVARFLQKPFALDELMRVYATHH